MRLRFQRVLRVAAATLMLTATVAVGTAHADSNQVCNADACLFRADRLTATPTDGMANIHLTRRIKLNRGTYGWHVLISSKICAHDITLAGGDYSWRALLDPKNGHYEVSSVIENVKGGTPLRHACNFTLNSGDHMRLLTWGSRLFGPR